MATGQKPDPRKRKTAPVHASYLKVPNGTKEAGYKAGELHGVYGHRIAYHKPCVQTITDAKVKCPYCAGEVPLVWRGYVPIWDRDWALRYVLVGEDVAESVDVIPHRANVAIVRAKNPISPLVVREELTLTRALPDRSPWNEPVDTLALCLLLWQNDELANWYAESNQAATSSARSSPVKSDGKPFGPMVKSAAQKYDAPAEAKTVEDDYDVIKSRLKSKVGIPQPSANGKKPH